MINIEQIATKAQTLDSTQLQELTDFLDFLLSKHKKNAKKTPVFTATQLESLDNPLIYHGPSLSLNDMQDAIEWEAGQSS
jgi:hypothetical protein